MSRRFYCEQPIAGGHASLAGDEARHLARVMRAGVGDEVVLWDGSGDEFAARISRIERDRVELQVLGRHAIDRELAHPLTLAVALPRGDRQRWLVEKTVELGVTRLLPLATTRGVAQPVDRAIARLSRAVVEASKQCGRNRLMEVALPADVDELARTIPAGTLRLVAHPRNASPETAAAYVPLYNAGTGPTCIAVGPEGGFTPDEIAALVQAGWKLVDLGPRILRVETAAVAVAAWCALAQHG